MERQHLEQQNKRANKSLALRMLGEKRPAYTCLKANRRGGRGFCPFIALHSSLKPPPSALSFHTLCYCSDEHRRTTEATEAPLPVHPQARSPLTGTLDTALAARTRSGSHAMSMWVPPPAAAALATLATRSASNLLSPEITFNHERAAAIFSSFRGDKLPN